MQTPLEKQIDTVLAAMADLKYSRDSIHYAERVFEKMRPFASSRKEDHFTDAFGEAFLKDVYSYSPRDGIRLRDLPYMVTFAVEAVKHLQQLSQYGCIHHNAQPKTLAQWALDDVDLVTRFFDKKRKLGVSENTIRIMTNRLHRFYTYLKADGKTTVRSVSIDLMNRFWISMQGDSPAYCRDRISLLGTYLRFLFLDGQFDNDYSKLLPKVMTPAKKSLPAIWTSENVKLLMSCIDRTNPVGKRDAAMFAIAADLGLRASDIIYMKLESLDFAKSEISFVQKKTGKPNVCQMTSTVGWLLIDYLEHGRPKSNEPWVFLTSRAPYTRLPDTAAVNALARYRKRCGLFIKAPKIVAGMHSLRHSLAHRLLESDVPLETIAEIMGHTQVNSSAPYLKIDTHGLTECALSIEEVKKYAAENV